MTIDFTVAAILAAFVFLGWRSGALSQAIRVGAAVLIVIAGPFVARLLREIVFGTESASVPLSEAASLVAAGILIYATVAIAGWLAIKVMRAASDTLSTMDRVGGATLGLIKGLVITYCLVFAALFITPALERVDPDDVLHMRDGHLTQFVERHNLLAPWHLPELERLHLMVRVARATEDASRHDVVREFADGKAADLLKDERVRELAEDDEIVAAARREDYVKTLEDERVRKLLNDEDFIEELEHVEWEVLLEEITPEGDEASVVHEQAAETP